MTDDTLPTAGRVPAFTSGTVVDDVQIVVRDICAKCGYPRQEGFGGLYMPDGRFFHHGCAPPEKCPSAGSFADGLRRAAGIVEDFRQSSELGDELDQIIAAIQNETPADVPGEMPSLSTTR